MFCCSRAPDAADADAPVAASSSGTRSRISTWRTKYLYRGSGDVCNGNCTTWRVTVEPVVLLYMLPTFMLLPCLHDLIYSKICESLYASSVCDRLTSLDNKAALDAVQSQSAHWIQASTILMCLPSMVMGQILGAYSDARGRKIPLLGPPLGGVLASLVYVLVSGTVLSLDVSWILLASFLTGIGGGFAACLNTSASYLTQVSPRQVRTSRVGVMECMVLLGSCVGPLLVGVMQQHYNKDKIFTVILAIHAANVLYILVAVPNVHASPPVSRLHPSERCPDAPQSLLTSVWRRLKQMFGVVCKTRHERRKTFLLMLILAAAVIMFCTSGQLDILYLFVADRPLQWALLQYTQYLALSGGLALASLVLIMLPLSHFCSDPLLLLVGASSRLGCLLLLGLASTDATVYTASVVGCCYSWCLPAIRSGMSKLVEPNELGRVFGLLGIVENACTLLASSVFTSLYPLTLDSYHGAVFLGAAAVMVVPVVVAGVLYRPLKRLGSYSTMESEEDDTSAPAGIAVHTDNNTGELSLGDATTADRTVRSISLSSSSSSSAITPITPSSSLESSGGGGLASDCPEIVDTNLSILPPNGNGSYGNNDRSQRAGNGSDNADTTRDPDSERDQNMAYER